MSITGNDERDRLLFEAMTAAAHADEALSVDNVKARLPSDFDLLPGELIAARHAAKLNNPASAPMIAENPDGHSLVLRETAPQAAPEPQGSVSDPSSVPGEQTPEPEARLNQAQARRAVESAAKRLDLARLAVRMARAARDVQRGKLSEAVTAWQNGGPKWTDQMEREHMRQSYAANKRSGPRMSTRKFPAQAVIEGRGVVSGFKGRNRNGLPSEMQHRSITQAGMFQGGIAKKI